MAERSVVFSMFEGENADKSESSGRAIFTEIRGMASVPPADDTNGGAVTVPGSFMLGDDTMTFLPAVHGEPSTITGNDPIGTPATSAELSSNFRKVRLVNITDERLAGNLIATFYSSDGVDSMTGACLGLHQTLWGGRIRGGDILQPLTEEDPDGVTILTPTEDEEIESFAYGAEEITWSAAAARPGGDAVYRVFRAIGSTTKPAEAVTETTDLAYDLTITEAGEYYVWVDVEWPDGQVATTGPRHFTITFP